MGATLFRHSPSRGRMTKKWVYWDRYPGLRLLRSLTPGFHLSPFQGLGFEAEVFYKPICDLLDRGSAIRHRAKLQALWNLDAPAECNSAIQQITNLRYVRGLISRSFFRRAVRARALLRDKFCRALQESPRNRLRLRALVYLHKHNPTANFAGCRRK
jgi:hypothetical protein